jgi:DNA-directed RNA polymerase specialized sigma24 family protein
MTEPAWLADQFEHWRPHMASVAYGMLGSVSEAEDAVQQAWPSSPDGRGTEVRYEDGDL